MEKFRNYLLKKPDAVESYPFGADVLVPKIGGKMFATYSKNSDGFYHMNLKCDPNEALALRDLFDAVIPGYHMNKKHWNTVILNGSVPNFEVERMIDRSYGLVVKSLKKTERQALLIKYGESEIYK